MAVMKSWSGLKGDFVSCFSSPRMFDEAGTSFKTLRQFWIDIAPLHLTCSWRKILLPSNSRKLLAWPALEILKLTEQCPETRNPKLNISLTQ